MPSGSKGNLGTTVTRAYNRNNKTGAVSLTSTSSRPTTDDRQNWAGSSLTHFHKRLKAGELLPYGSYKKFQVLHLEHNCDTSSRYVAGTMDNTSYWDNGHPGVMPLLTESDLIYMLGKFDAKPYVQAAAAKIASSGFDLLTFVAELHQTYAMWKGVGKTITNLLNRTKGSVVDSWLQYRYGWRCLYYDLRNIQKLINSMDEKRVRIKERVGRDLTSTNTTQFTTAWQSSTTVWQYEDRITCGLRGLVCADVDIPPISINPFVTAWELVKFSFIIDWFLQVGQWISTMTFLSSEEKHFAAECYALTCTRTLSQVSQQMNPGHTYLTWQFHQQHSAKLLLRTPTSIPLGIQTTLKLDAFKVTDLIALVLQSLRR